MKPDKWTQQLQDKLADYQTPAPEGLWDDIEASLSSEGISNPPQRNARFVTLRRWAAAAAIAALIGGGGLVWWSQEEQQKESLVSMEESNLAESSETEYHSMDNVEEQCADAPLPSRGKVGGGVRNSSPYASIAQAATHQEKLQTPPIEGRGMAAHEESTATLPQTEIPQTTLPQTKESQTDCVQENSPHISHSSRPLPIVGKRRHSPSLNLYAMNSLGAKDNSNAVFMADALAKNYINTFSEENLPAARRQSPIFLSGYEERQHHYQPVGFGLTFDYPLTNRLSLTSGIVYTRLRSDFTQIIRSQHISQEQTLHYIGVPLGLSYRLYQLGAFSAYVAAGIQADWNIAARQNAEGVERHIDRDRMQWSASASLGLQYSLPVGGTDIALYAEPGISHYFDNSSPVQNFFKDKPTSMKLQVGLRFRP